MKSRGWHRADSAFPVRRADPAFLGVVAVSSLAHRRSSTVVGMISHVRVLLELRAMLDAAEDDVECSCPAHAGSPLALGTIVRRSAMPRERDEREPSRGKPAMT